MDVKNNNLPRISSQLEKAISELVRKPALGIEAKAKELAPFDTGRLKNSLTTVIEEPTRATVGTNVPYSIFQEFGTRHMKSQSFLTPAFDAEMKNFEDGVRKIENGLK